MRALACISLCLAAALLTGCASWAPAFSDLVPPDRDYLKTMAELKRSIDAALNPQSTRADIRAWFHRHHVPIFNEEGLSIYGGFSPLKTYGFWAADHVTVEIRVSPDGKFTAYDIRDDHPCL